MEEIYDDGAIDFESNKPFCAVYKECGGGTVERKDIYGAIDIGLHNHIRLNFYCWGNSSIPEGRFSKW